MWSRLAFFWSTLPKVAWSRFLKGVERWWALGWSATLSGVSTKPQEIQLERVIDFPNRVIGRNRLLPRCDKLYLLLMKNNAQS